MSDDVADTRLTPRQFRAVAYHIARTYLEVERNLRDSRHLRGFLTAAEYRRHQLAPPPRPQSTGPVRPEDIGRVSLDSSGKDSVSASARIRRGEDAWSTLIIDLRRAVAGWQVDRLGRLEHLLPLEPSEVRVAEHDLERRLGLAEEDRRSVRLAHEAATRRYDHSDDKRTRSARVLRQERDGWARLLDAVDGEVAVLVEQRAHREFLGAACMPASAELDDGGERIDPADLLGPRPDGGSCADHWDDAAAALREYSGRWGVHTVAGLLEAGSGVAREAERRRLFRRMGAVHHEVGPGARILREPGMDAAPSAARHHEPSHPENAELTR